MSSLKKENKKKAIIGKMRQTDCLYKKTGRLQCAIFEIGYQSSGLFTGTSSLMPSIVESVLLVAYSVYKRLFCNFRIAY